MARCVDVSDRVSALRLADLPMVHRLLLSSAGLYVPDTMTNKIRKPSSTYRKLRSHGITCTQATPERLKHTCSRPIRTKRDAQNMPAVPLFTIFKAMLVSRTSEVTTTVEPSQRMVLKVHTGRTPSGPSKAQGFDYRSCHEGLKT